MPPDRPDAPPLPAGPQAFEVPMGRGSDDAVVRTVAEPHGARQGDGHIGPALNQHHVGGLRADHGPKHAPRGSHTKVAVPDVRRSDQTGNGSSADDGACVRPLDGNDPVTEVLTPEAVERRFGTYRAPAVVEMLSDNGSPYIARDTQIFARQLGLKPCFTPVRSPQSNSMSEAFVKTLKRDYVQATPLSDAQTALGLIGGWIEDYNDNHPHSGLKMRSPSEFIADQTATAGVPGETGARPLQGTSIMLAAYAPTTDRSMHPGDLRQRSLC